MDVSIQKKKDILNYLGVFLISQISFMKLFVPFVIGFIEKREEEIHKKLILYGISIITVILRFSFYEGIEYIKVHPTFFYESICSFLLLKK